MNDSVVVKEDQRICNNLPLLRGKMAIMLYFTNNTLCFQVYK